MALIPGGTKPRFGSGGAPNGSAPVTPRARRVFQWQWR